LLLLSLLAGLLLAPPRSAAQETAESRAFKSAVGFFQTEVYGRAEREFQLFVETYPQSTLRAEAILFQARAAMYQTNLAGAISLLSAHVAKAGPLADQYFYRLATAHFQTNNYPAAVESFLRVTSQFTNSPMLLEASYGEALARFRLREFRRVVILLRDPQGAFQQASRARPTDVSTLRGQLLLAEALLEQKEFREAEAAAREMAEESLTPEIRWDRQYLLCRILVADQRLPLALAQTTNLVSVAAATASRLLLADSVAMQADIFQQLNRLPEAALAYTNNLAETVPADRRRLAFLKIVEIKLALDEVDEAAQMLQLFLLRQPDDTATDFILLAAGELQLKLHLRAPADNTTEGSAVPGPSAATNHLQAALVQFDQLINGYPNSPLRGKAFLDKGWCLWLDDKVPESALAFSGATNLLPFSEDLAIARFKLADALYRQGDYTNAIGLYRALTNDLTRLPRVQETLFEQTLYQIVRASIESGDAAGAAAAMQQMLEWSPTSELSERGIWLVAQDRMRLRKPKEARAMFDQFIRRFPERPLVPEVELAIGRSYQLDDNWPAALQVYEEWLDHHPTNSFRPTAEYCRALATGRCGNASNAFHLFTNFVASFPTHRLARQAQLWVAQEYLGQSNYREAVRQFQLVAENTNWPVDRVTWEARMLAGRAAFAGQLWKDAEGHFTLLINNRECPDNIVAEAEYAYGDTLLSENNAEPGDPMKRYIDARNTFSLIKQNYPNHPLAARAWGRIGDCNLQLASKEPEQYRNATNAYAQAMGHPAADIDTRRIAEFGLAHALKLQAAGKPPTESISLLKAALDHLLNILLGSNLQDGEEPDPLWIYKAGMDAARVAEDLKQWSMAVRIYERLQTSLPALRPRVQDKIRKAQEQSRAEREPGAF